MSSTISSSLTSCSQPTAQTLTLTSGPTLPEAMALAFPTVRRLYFFVCGFLLSSYTLGYVGYSPLLGSVVVGHGLGHSILCGNKGYQIAQANADHVIKVNGK